MTTKIKSTGIDSGNTFSFGNVVITGTITANGSIGTPGQVLATDGTKIYWTGDIGGNAGPNIVSVVVSTSSYVSSGNTTIDATGGYIYVTGNNFVTGTTAYIGNTVATSVTVTSGTRLNIALPALNPGVYDLEIMKPGGITSKKFSALTYVFSYNTHGYMTGGMASSPNTLDMQGLAGTASAVQTYSSVERVTFSNDTSIMSMRASISTQILAHTSFGTKDAGYLMWGLYGASNYIGGYKSTFASDTTSAGTRFTNPDSRSYLSGGISGLNYGWSGGGTGGTGTTGYTSVFRLIFASDTSTPLQRTTLNINAGVGKSIGTTYDKSYGYFIGGATSNASSSTTVTTCERLDLSNDTAPTLSRGFVTDSTRSCYGNVFTTYTYMWMMRACSFSGTTSLTSSYINKWDLSNDTSSTSIAGSSTGTGSGGSQNLYYGYAISGTPSPTNGTTLSSIFRLDFSSTTESALATKVNQSRHTCGGWSGTTTTV